MRLGLLAIALLVGCTGRETSTTADETYRIAGSDTELNVVQRLAERFREHNPNTSISVTGGGSGAGIAALLEGRAHIANASRKVSDEERAAAARSGQRLIELPIGIDAIAVIVNANNPVHALSVEDVGRLFRGDARRWSAVGAKDAEVTLYGRQSNSGTYVYVRSAVLNGDYALEMLSMNGNAQIVEAVHQDENGIGYVGVGYVSHADPDVSGVRVLSLITKTGDTVSPLDLEAVVQGRYPITRPLFQYFTGALPPGLAAFLEFELSEDGQAIVVREGFHHAPATWRTEGLARLAKQREKT